MVVYQNRSYVTGTVRTSLKFPDGYAKAADFEGGHFDPAELGPALRRGLEQIHKRRPAVIAV